MPQALLKPVEGYKFYTYTPSKVRAIELASKLHGEVITSLDHLSTTDDYDIYLLGCKPQQFLELSLKLKGRIPPTALVVSMLAGIDHETLNLELGHLSIIRIMPNITANINKGSILVFPFLDTHTRESLRFLEATSKLYEMQTENDFDKLMLITGSGPAYMFYLIRSFERYLVSQGLKSQDYLGGILDTFSGAIDLMKESPELSTSDFISRVASKGGVTEQALNIFDEANFDHMISKAISTGVKHSDKLKLKAKR